MTEDCEMFKQHLDDLVSHGYLKEFIQKEHKGAEKEMELDYKQNLRGVIHMIHGLVTPYTRNEVRLLQRQVPDSDALVITLRIEEYDMERILVDSGSCTEVRTLPVQVGTVVLRTDFLVVDVSSSYNGIIGRTWLHKMRAVSSTYQQMLKFPGSNGIERIRGNQKVAQQCLVSIIKKAPKAKLVQAIEVPDQPTIEDVKGNPAEKVVEGLKKIQINETDPERYFLTRENLNKEEEKELVGSLKEHVDVFAWVPEEMPGVDRLLEAKAIREVYYPEWLSNTVVVKKKNGKWCVCVDFTDLNKACPKDSFPLPRIDQ
ncbi:uncharacterized protein LOC131324001 [Rhododendron vialii]|uniref:uncharacterized protein LOC131324001 n=1 Tax=Rhododendron vialii TaxID=182163 RepID=UPI00265F7023|nr:uncharacterized protein LOC131324001 [Rhododendron vialii]